MMEHVYQVTGMHCGSCKSKVEAALSAVDEVTQVNVDLPEGSATIEMNSHVALETLQQSLLDQDLPYHIDVPGTGASATTTRHPSP